MIKKIRIKLILVSVFSLFFVLLVIMAGIAAINYHKITQSADEVLWILTDNGGDFPDDMVQTGDNPGNNIRNNMKISQKISMMSPELPYEIRYFSVKFNVDGEITSVNTGKIAAVDTSSAISYAEEILKKNKTSGFKDSYRYMVTSDEKGSQIIFLDCRRTLETFMDFVLTGILVSAAGVAAVMFLIILLSGQIVRPFSENYDKQKRFITDAGHELKTPLTIIDADAEIIEMDIGENEWLTDIKSQTRRLADLTNSLILLSKAEEGESLQLIQFPLSDVIEEECCAFKALAVTGNKILEADIEKMISFKGDEKLIRRLTAILVDNAIKYSDDGGYIKISLKKQKNQIKFTVYNTVDYISAKNISRLFDRFYREDSSRNSETGGYGLGLSIAEAIVTSHRGKITAATEGEKSLRITVTMPL